MKDIEANLLKIRDLLTQQLFASLATSGKESIHSALVAFAVHDSLETIFFSTPQSTRKYQNLLSSPGVSLLVHNGENSIEDVTHSCALTVTGHAETLSGIDREEALQILQAKHRYLREMLNSPEVATVAIRVTQYDLVTNFQDVRTITVTSEEL